MASPARRGYLKAAYYAGLAVVIHVVVLTLHAWIVSLLPVPELDRANQEVEVTWIETPSPEEENVQLPEPTPPPEEAQKPTVPPDQPTPTSPEIAKVNPTPPEKVEPPKIEPPKVKPPEKKEKVPEVALIPVPPPP